MKSGCQTTIYLTLGYKKSVSLRSLGGGGWGVKASLDQKSSIVSEHVNPNLNRYLNLTINGVGRTVKTVKCEYLGLSWRRGDVLSCSRPLGADREDVCGYSPCF